jgi:cysteine desulfurase
MIEVIDPGNNSLPNIIALRTCQMEGQYAMLECSQQGLAISTGTACQVNEQKPSAVLLALGYSEQESRQLIRLSLSKFTSNDELYDAAEILSEILKKQSRFVMS